MPNTCDNCQTSPVRVSACPGCKKNLCRECIPEHDRNLERSFDELVIEHDALKYELDSKHPDHSKNHSIIAEIDAWETETVEKIRNTAENIRRIVQKTIEEDQRNIRNNLKTLSDEIQNLQKLKQYLEPEIEGIQTKINSFRLELKHLKKSKAITINKENSNRVPWDRLIVVEKIEEKRSIISRPLPPPRRSKLML